jgi:hypothetical protein
MASTVFPAKAGAVANKLAAAAAAINRGFVNFFM